MGLQRGAQWYGHTSWISRVALLARDSALIAPVTAATKTTAYATRSPSLLYCSAYTDVKSAVDLKSPSAVVALSALSFRVSISLSRGGAWAGRRVASCVLGEGANELAEASIIATTRVRFIMARRFPPVKRFANFRKAGGGARPVITDIRRETSRHHVFSVPIPTHQTSNCAREDKATSNIYVGNRSGCAPSARALTPKP